MLQEIFVQIEKLIEQRKIAKIENNWQLADKLRESLHRENIIVQDHQDGSTTWYKK